ncbi:uncharacterized protein BUCNMO_147 [Buchnera aphidicola (Nipponaphis monzeni)]|uniref:DUF2076 domain-containing protein n=1 Tax=Buchnera aphidicola (Nipponaphis monzeni) TaxID=2495405 RepID=A0A455TA06_9GAMM|nr:DUF2076 family protein [Buchnera aphidicola]BBI01162.1 uncharacterized protein BUCNMO_147 [Buchnera aphidicola (Nipponaphis monzeni)]
MKPEEKALIESLFNRLKVIEEKFPNRNRLVSEYISSLVKNQPNSIYYIAQTTLIQEVAIKKLNKKILYLEKKISDLISQKNHKEPSFLSSLFGSSKKSKKTQNFENNNFETSAIPNSGNNNLKALNNSSPVSSLGNSFIGNALQTAAGVAGGIVVGNMLMNLFHKDKPEEEIFDTIQEDATFSNLESYDFNNKDQFLSTSEDFLVNHDDSQLNSVTETLDQEILETEHDTNNVIDNQYYDDSDNNSFDNATLDDIDDDNFI